jgi:hypothetical protein
MRRLLLAALLLMALPLLAVDTGKADGKVVLNGKTVRFTQSYAWESDDGIVVLLTDKPLAKEANPRTFAEAVPPGTQALTIYFGDDTDTTKVRSIVIQHADGKFVLDAPETGMMLQTDDDAIEGNLSTTGTTTSPAGATVRIRVAFNAEFSE